MRAAVVFAYWVLTILFIVAVVAVPATWGIAIWTEDGRWGWTGVLCGAAAFVFMFLAASIEIEENG